MISRSLNEKIHVYLTHLLALLIPVYPKVLPILIILVGLTWLINPINIRESFKQLKRYLSLLLICLFYILYLAGLTYSNNLKFGWGVVETKLSFLILPVVYAAYHQSTVKHLESYLKFFVYGCIAYSCFAFGWASYSFFKPVYTDLYGVLYDLGANYFYYSYLANIFHPSYTSMYSAFALFAIIYLQYKKALKDNWLWMLIMLLLCLYILLLSSKAGWIVLMLWAVAYLFIKIRKKAYLNVVVIMFFLVAAFLVLNVYYPPNFSQRIPKLTTITKAINERDENNNKVTTSDDGSARRIFVWKASFEIFRNNFLTGVGTGDSEQEMLKTYFQKEMIAEYKAELNSHNQYLNTAVPLGVIGLITLMLCLLVPFIKGIQSSEYLVSGFIIIIAVNFLFESMLEKQDGVIFYTFINTILCVGALSLNSNGSHQPAKE